MFVQGFGPVNDKDGLDVIEIFAGSHRIYSMALECGLQATAFDVIWLQSLHVFTSGQKLCQLVYRSSFSTFDIIHFTYLLSLR